MMITAGPTYEKIDPVRFIGNYSSGKWASPLLKNVFAVVRMLRWWQVLSR